jgi:hypothetical protein
MGIFASKCTRLETKARLCAPSLVSARSYTAAPFPFCQSLHQMKVPHRHSVPLSFCPLGPSGLAHMKKLRPWLLPFFLVCIVLQGSEWSSHLGAVGREFKRADQLAEVAERASKLLREAVGDAKDTADAGVAESLDFEGGVEGFRVALGSDESSLPNGVAESPMGSASLVAMPLSIFEAASSSVLLGGAALGWKKPRKLC